jgi:hypothetical protein
MAQGSMHNDNTNSIQFTFSQLAAACQCLDSGGSTGQQQSSIASAQSYLLAHKQSAQPYALCHEIIESSNTQNTSPSLLFHALTTLLHALLRDYSKSIATCDSNNSQPLVAAQQRLQSEQQRLITFLIRSSASTSIPAYVQRETIHVLALLFKRSWQYSPSTAAHQSAQQLWTSVVEPLIHSNHQSIALQLLTATTHEFAISTVLHSSASQRNATALGLSLYAHTRLHLSWQRLMLPQIMKLALHCQHEALQSIQQHQSKDKINLLRSSIDCCHTILQWRFVQQSKASSAQQDEETNAA